MLPTIIKISAEIGWVNLDQLVHAEPNAEGLLMRFSAPQAVEAGKGKWSTDAYQLQVPAAEAIGVADELDRLKKKRT